MFTKVLPEGDFHKYLKIIGMKLKRLEHYKGSMVIPDYAPAVAHYAYVGCIWMYMYDIYLSKFTA